MKIADIMTSNVEWCKPESKIYEAAEKMKELDVGVMPICDSGSVVGVVTDRDVVIKGVANNIPVDAQVSQVMSTDPVTGNRNMLVEDAAELMADHQIRRLPIVDDDKLVGIVSLGDLAVNQNTDRKAGEALEDISYPSEPEQ
ncbi:CBS domain-containing protein [Bacillus aerolatus]|uniref:CBS domain-containing protein n=1 Tax=Bacillus aerolatus TaxID=2653354 RepID=A0A6I1FKB9_9BACI|nr:CBS domain-containing protein [Bacillus aerolatus]KAB7707092.1 CBS domain-containing protein [Bacillus aerolatus]